MLKKSLGQHLLKDKNLLKKMVRLTGIGPEDHVIEIGPGHGDFTRVLAAGAGSVTAIELDERFQEYLCPLEEECSNVKVLFSDVLRVSFEDLAAGRSVTVVGNIPYNITGEILFKVLAAKQVVNRAFLLMQKEVAERIVSASHCRSYGAVSVIFQIYSAVKIILTVHPGLFIPPPKVESAFLSIRFKDMDGIDEGLVAFIKSCFRYKRKYMKNSLEGLYPAEKIDDLYRRMAFAPSVRAEEIEPEGFAAMYQVMRQN